MANVAAAETRPAVLSLEAEAILFTSVIVIMAVADTLPIGSKAKVDIYTAIQAISGVMSHVDRLEPTVSALVEEFTTDPLAVQPLGERA